MDGCRTEIPIQLKTCKCIQSCCFGTRPTSSPGHSADRQEPMVAQKTHYENKCKIIPANTNKKTNLFVFGEYEYERIRGGPYSLRIIRLVQNITNIWRIRIRTNIGRLSLFVFGEYEYTAIPGLTSNLCAGSTSLATQVLGLDRKGEIEHDKASTL
jgi:hypothetical protein